MMITSKFSEFIQFTSYDKLPENAVTKAKLCFTDFLGVAFKGSKTKSGLAMKSITKVGNESTVIGHGKASALEAGLANGVFAHSLDLDDGHRQAQLHPGACVIPAALSLCESRNQSGEKFIESMVVGYQVAILMGMMVNPEHRSRGFHSTGTCGTLGAAAAAAKALDLNEIKIINALGLAGTQAAGLLESDHSGSMAKHLHAGKAAQSGILSAILAEKGFNGSETIIEGAEGFLKSMTSIDPHEITADSLNFDMSKLRINEVYFKIYPVCRHLHSSIDALLFILNNNHVKSEEIEKISVKTYKIAAEHNNYYPDTIEALRQSLPVSLALTILNNQQGLNNYLEFDYKPQDQNLNKKIDDITQKIFIEYDKDLDILYPNKRPSEVTIKTKKGIFEKSVDLAYGEPENPLNNSDIIGKFQNLNPKMNIRALQIIDNIDSYHDINQFMEELISILNEF